MGRTKGALNKAIRKDAIITPDEKEALDTIVFKNKNFTGRDAIWNIAKQQYPKEKYPNLKISRPKVMQYLKGIESYQLFHQKRQTKHIQTTVFGSKNKQIAMDLIDMTSMAAGDYKWILTAIDMYSRKSYVEIMKDKTDETALAAFKKLLTQIKTANNGESPKSIRSDRGSEFTNDKFKEYLKENNIKQVLSSANLPQSNGMIERFNGKLKRQIKMIRAQMDNNNWAEYVQEINTNLNNTYHRIIKTTPNDLHEGAAHTKQKAMESMEKHAKKSAWLEPKPFDVGDVVRIKQTVAELYNFSKNTFTVTRVLQPRSSTRKRAYLLRNNATNEDVRKKFYANDLIRASTVKYQVQVPDKFAITKIYKPLLYKGKKFLLIKWTTESKPTWEPYEVIKSDAPKITAKFEKLVGLKWEPTLEWDKDALKLTRWPKDPPYPHVDTGEDKTAVVGKLPPVSPSEPTDEIIKKFTFKRKEKKPAKVLYGDVADITYRDHPIPKIKPDSWGFVLWRTTAKTNNMRIYIAIVKEFDDDWITVYYNPKNKKQTEKIDPDYFISYSSENFDELLANIKR